MRKKVLVVGLDGLEPTIVERLMQRNELPNFAKIRSAGYYGRLGTTYPALPASRVRWRSDPAHAVLATRPATYPPRSRGILACNGPPASTFESPSPCSHSHSRNPSTSVDSASSPQGWSSHHSSGSSAVAECAPIPPRGTAGTPACG